MIFGLFYGYTTGVNDTILTINIRNFAGYLILMTQCKDRVQVLRMYRSWVRIPTGINTFHEFCVLHLFLYGVLLLVVNPQIQSNTVLK